MPTKIIDSFQQRLPHIDSDHDGYRSITYSSKSTRKQLAPPAFFNEPAENFAAAARKYLEARKNDPNYLRTAKTEYLAPKEESQVLVNEADVVRASGQQLINPVNIVLQDIHRLDIKVLCNSEVARRSETAAVRSDESKDDGKKNTQPDCRFGLRWAFGTDNTSIKKRKTASDKEGDKSNRDDGAGDIFAILEFKNTDVLFWDDFKHASCTRENVDEIMAKVEGIQAQKDNHDVTLLRDNAEVVSRQASKYANLCPDIALFDWNSMFIFDFSGEDDDDELPLGTFFQEEPNGGITFREMLLCFLIRALARHGQLPEPNHART